MSHWLLYWKDYPIEVNYDPFDGGWHTNQEPFFRKVQRGDSLWVVVYGVLENPDKWILFERLIASRKRVKSTPRQYCVIGDPKKSERFALKRQGDLESLLRKLQFKSGIKIKAKGRLIGRSLQTIRQLADEDSKLLDSYSRSLGRSRH